MTQENFDRRERRTKLWLLGMSLTTIALLATAALQENYFNEWHALRAAHKKILETKATDEIGKAALEGFEVRIVQNYVPTLGRADRCMTCHAGVGDPRMADQAQPFKTHPGRYLEIHDPEKFGCTVCHDGQGRATTVADAHGATAHWDYPLLAADNVRASCTRCHTEADLYGKDGLLVRADGEDVDAASRELLARGRTLVAESGCVGCHVRNGKGGRIGPSLDLIGEKTKHDLDFSHVAHHEGARRVDHWLVEHFLDPSGVSPGSAMPAIADRTDARALTAYMLTGRKREGAFLASTANEGSGGLLGRSADEVDGETLYLSYCSACHGASGEGSMVPSIVSPSLSSLDALSVASDDFYRTIIERGRSGSEMPAWGPGAGNLSRSEIDRIVAHMRTWQPTGALVGDVLSTRGEAESGKAYYQGLCAGCHGRDGDGGIGNGLASPTFLAIADDAFLARSIIEGRPGTAMPAWPQLGTEAVADLIAYVRSWQAEPPSELAVDAARASTSSVENARIGAALFRNHCASCHGDDLGGGIGPSLDSPDFLGAIDDTYLYRAIVDGRPGTAMPAWKHLSADDVGAIIEFLRAQARPARSGHADEVGGLEVGTAGDDAFSQGSDVDDASLGRAMPPVGMGRDGMERGDPAVGALYYATACKSCHGVDAQGGVGPQLANPVFLATVSDEALFHWIAHGRAGTSMEGFLAEEQGPIELTRGQILDVIAYLRDLDARREVPVQRLGAGVPELGADYFVGHCASCHGPNGEGASGPQLNNPAFLRNASDGFLAATIVLGRTGTPMQPMVHGSEGIGQIPPASVADVIAYMRRWESRGGWHEPRRVAEISEWAVREGAAGYASYCSGCHGVTGRGGRDDDGNYAPALNNPEFLEAASDGFLLATIARGRTGTPMRPFGEGAGGIVSLDSETIANIVAYLRSWQATNASPQ